VKLTEPKHVVLGDGVSIIGSIAVVPVEAGNAICERHQTITTAEAQKRFGEIRDRDK
jgi:hypothetical protein